MCPWTKYTDGDELGGVMIAPRPSPIRPTGLLRAVRRRDGDRCRLCGRIVQWTDRRSANRGMYHHLNEALPATEDNVVVTCAACDAAQKDPKPEPYLLPAPLVPIYGRSTRKLIYGGQPAKTEGASKSLDRVVVLVERDSAVTVKQLVEVLYQPGDLPKATFVKVVIESDLALRADPHTGVTIRFLPGNDGLEKERLPQGEPLVDHGFKSADHFRPSAEGFDRAAQGVSEAVTHETSPSVSAPDGAGVGTPTVGAEEGGASDSPTDAPPTPSTSEPAAPEGEARP